MKDDDRCLGGLALSLPAYTQHGQRLQHDLSGDYALFCHGQTISVSDSAGDAGARCGEIVPHRTSAEGSGPRPTRHTVYLGVNLGI